MYAVILAGGGGTRLWPLSTPARPKPFLPLLGARSLLQLTGARLAGLVAPADTFVVTDRRYGPLVRRQLPAATVVEEPFGRNTAPAVALAALAIARPADEVMVVLPADHVIDDEVGFRAVVRAAGAVATEDFVDDALVTLGIQPTGPATTYGYIVATAERREIGGSAAFRAERFVEKPPLARARQLLAGPQQASWNGGIFVWRRRSILAALERDAPDIVHALHGGLGEDLARAYDGLRATSIDYAVLEPASLLGQVAVVQMQVGWSDLGSWSVLLERLGAPAVRARVVQAGDPVELRSDDLLVRRDGWPEGGPFALDAGPGRMGPFAAPTALLAGARADRAVVEALLERVTAQEA